MAGHDIGQCGQDCPALTSNSLLHLFTEGAVSACITRGHHSAVATLLGLEVNQLCRLLRPCCSARGIYFTDQLPIPIPNMGLKKLFTPFLAQELKELIH